MNEKEKRDSRDVIKIFLKEGNFHTEELHSVIENLIILFKSDEDLGIKPKQKDILIAVLYRLAEEGDKLLNIWHEFSDYIEKNL